MTRDSHRSLLQILSHLKNVGTMFFEISQLQHGPLKKVKVKYFWNLLRISKLSLLLIFGEVEAEILSSSRSGSRSCLGQSKGPGQGSSLK